MASQPYTAPDGRVFAQLPCIAVLEEFDGLARRRGQGDPIFDRVLTTLLQYLDATRPEISRNLVYWVATTNIAHEVDSAAIRRIGGRRERFGHLRAPAFASVLDTHLKGLPLASRNGHQDAADIRRALVSELTGWIFHANGDDGGQVRVLYANRDAQIKHRRHFMTGALVSTSVQDAADQGWLEELDGDTVSLTAEYLKEAFDEQIGATARQLTKHNAGTLIEIPSGAHVSDIQVLRQPTLAQYQLQV